MVLLGALIAARAHEQAWAAAVHAENCFYFFKTSSFFRLDVWVKGGDCRGLLGALAQWKARKVVLCRGRGGLRDSTRKPQCDSRDNNKIRFHNYSLKNGVKISYQVLSLLLLLALRFVQ
jgi:hypothetical protein